MMVQAPRFAMPQAYFVPAKPDPVSNELEQQRRWIDSQIVARPDAHDQDLPSRPH
jgi:hypothetical protein